jgi:CelD/BcsL family acetyltransferase involved in cellulose biosynthesis
MIELGWQTVENRWARELADHWPTGRARVVERDHSVRHWIDLASGVDDWLARRSRNFRKIRLRRYRGIESIGATFNSYTIGDEVCGRLPALQQLWNRRREEREDGGVVIDDRFVAGLSRIAASTDATLMLSSLELGSQVLAMMANLCLGSTASMWFIGHDSNFSDLAPGYTLYMWTIEEAARLGISDIDLGLGDQDYKARLSDTTEPVAEVVLSCRSGSIRRAAQLVPYATRYRARRTVATQGERVMQRYPALQSLGESLPLGRLRS